MAEVKGDLSVKRNLILDNLKSKKNISTDAQGKVIENTDEYIKLDQTTPQTITGLLDGVLKLVSGVIETEDLDLKYKQIIPISGSLTRDGNGYIQTITKGTTTLTITRDGNNLISSVTNGTWVLTINRSGGYITSWSVT